MSISSRISETFPHTQSRRGQRRNPAMRTRKARFFPEQLEGRADPVLTCSREIGDRVKKVVETADDWEEDE